MKKNNIMRESSKTYRPFIFPWAHESFLKQQSMHWLPDEIDFSRDKTDFENKLSDLEREVIKRVLLFFTQMDVEVGKCYLDLFIPYFQNLEIRRMLVSFANMEQIHAQAYNQLLQVLDLPLNLEEEFLQIKEMSDKQDYLHSVQILNDEDMAKAMCIVSAGTEGFVLYSSFAVLFSFSSERAQYNYSDNQTHSEGNKKVISGNCLTGVGQVIEWSMRDESHHSSSMIRLCLEFCKLTNIDLKSLEDHVHKEFNKLFNLECKFIDYIFKDGDLPYLTSEQVKNYVKYMANLRLKQLGMKPIFEGEYLLPFMEAVLFFPAFANFFDTVPTEYDKSLNLGDMSNVFEKAFK